MLWKLKKADSTTFGSGPSKDHTLGTDKGMKMINNVCIEKPLKTVWVNKIWKERKETLSLVFPHRNYR